MSGGRERRGPAARRPDARPRRSLPGPFGAALACALVLAGAGCGPARPGPDRTLSYAYPVPPEATFDLRRGEPLSPEQVAAQLASVRLLFLGEHHTEPRSHAFQRETLDRLARSGRPLRVALEMFPPAADAALEDWRQGRSDELTFLEQADWYTHWGFPWSTYRDLFLLFRERHLELHGVNATRAERDAVRADRPADLPADLRALLGPLDETVPPHRAYLLDTLRGVGHGGDLQPDSDGFRRAYRVQRLWDRLLGVRAARLALAQPTDGITVLLLGSGHLAYGLGANLQAAREALLPQLTVWDARVAPQELDAQGRYPVAVGMADWVRIYVQRDPQPDYPTLAGLRLEAAADGVRVQAVHAGKASPLRSLQADDVILALNGAAPRSPTALRLAFEGLPFGKPAQLSVRRAGQTRTVELTPTPDE